MTGTEQHRTEDENSDPLWYRRVINIGSAILLFFIWHAAAWGCSRLFGQAEDHWFLGIVAVTVALHLPSRRPHD